MKHILFSFSLLLLISACVRKNQQPIWLSLDKWVLEENNIAPGEAGQLTENFSDVWVYVDNKAIGVFELPCKIPVLASGSNIKIELFPAIRNNGIAASKKIYPFCESDVRYVNLVEGQTYSFTPLTRYYSNLQFWIEDFSSSTIGIETDISCDAQLIRAVNSTISLTPGNYYGHIHLTPTDSLWIGRTIDQSVLPKNGKEVYLEIDYRNSIGLLTGLIAFSPNGNKLNPNILLNAQEMNSMKWKKIYIDLKEMVSFSTSAEYFKQYFRAMLDEDEQDGDIYIDNIKVVHF